MAFHRMTNGLPEIIVGAIKTRFATTIDSKLSLPKFKLREDDFFSFAEEPNVMADVPVSVKTEVTSYFNSDPVMESLHQFPRIKNIALRYNAPTPVKKTFQSWESGTHPKMQPSWRWTLSAPYSDAFQQIFKSSGYNGIGFYFQFFHVQLLTTSVFYLS